MGQTGHVLFDPVCLIEINNKTKLVVCNSLSE